ncbi:hypothetical protein NT01EI_1917 [Edwardsiella ictaluri 93-146]|uniref:Uncharacterized protein n=1 Tax=Edwardsiella ictaluri (strain 93-146) TaxID=634503 RepID=C5B877_EDWI9|nr:hypothetical protein NT01EI_1917 [Edwardsiella ictaluri 93-146]
MGFFLSVMVQTATGRLFLTRREKIKMAEKTAALQRPF